MQRQVEDLERVLALLEPNRARLQREYDEARLNLESRNNDYWRAKQLMADTQ